MEKKFYIINKIDANTAEILLYGYIGPFDVSASDFVNELRNLDKQYSQINVRVNSGGGDVFEGLTMYNALKNCKAETAAYIDGIAGSMATIVIMGCSKILMSKVAMFMTHSPSMYTGGNANELKQGAEVLDGMEKTMAAIYANKTGKSVEDCKTLFLGSDKWFTADQAKENGLVDELYDAEPMDVAAAAKNEKEVWNIYHEKRFAAQFISNENKNMKQYTMTAAVTAALGLTDNSDQATVEAKITEMAAKAARVDVAEAAKKKAEEDLAAYKETENKAKVKTMLDAALEAKKITVELKTKFEKQFAANPDELKDILDAMKAYEPVVKTGTGMADAKAKRLGELSAKTYDELHKADELEELKKLNEEEFKAKYKEKFNKEYTA